MPDQRTSNTEKPWSCATHPEEARLAMVATCSLPAPAASTTRSGIIRPDASSPRRICFEKAVRRSSLKLPTRCCSAHRARTAEQFRTSPRRPTACRSRIGRRPRIGERLARGRRDVQQPDAGSASGLCLAARLVVADLAVEHGPDLASRQPRGRVDVLARSGEAAAVARPTSTQSNAHTALQLLPPRMISPSVRGPFERSTVPIVQPVGPTSG